MFASWWESGAAAEGGTAMTTIRAPALGERPLVIDGAHGEGGGEILRTALSLSVITGRSVTLVNIRAGRPKPGLAAQHLTAVRAAAALCAAEVIGAELGALTLAATPSTLPKPARAAAPVRRHWSCKRSCCRWPSPMANRQ
jgi:hypothetical protein